MNQIVVYLPSTTSITAKQSSYKIDVRLKYIINIGVTWLGHHTIKNSFFILKIMKHILKKLQVYPRNSFHITRVSRTLSSFTLLLSSLPLRPSSPSKTGHLRRRWRRVTGHYYISATVICFWKGKQLKQALSSLSHFLFNSTWCWFWMDEFVLENFVKQFECFFFFLCMIFNWFIYLFS
jgi:hypothetical protein